eukprot:GHVN01018185.1.p2 GENE.GHVN01018185.1~~GHVN01018185.1.p2  ORF type:complete len:146 (+),score=17.25 GHVN01018185.1:846-1283(+)
MATPPEKVTLVAADGEKVETTGTAMLQSKFLKDMIGDLRPDEEIPLPNVRAGALKVIVKYCEYHTTAAVAVLKKPLPNKGLEEMVDAYDASVVDVEAHVSVRGGSGCCLTQQDTFVVMQLAVKTHTFSPPLILAPHSPVRYFWNF